MSWSFRIGIETQEALNLVKDGKYLIEEKHEEPFHNTIYLKFKDNEISFPGDILVGNFKKDKSDKIIDSISQKKPMYYSHTWQLHNGKLIYWFYDYPKK